MTDAPVQPKKPAGGAYGQFLSEKRKEFTEQCKGKPACEVSKLAAAEWKKLSQEQQTPYQQKYEAAKKKYEEDMAAFVSAGGVKQKGTAALRSEKRKAKDGKKPKAAKDPNAPKKPVGGAYGCYLAKHREAITKECAGKPVTEISKVAGERWKKLSASEKEVFEKEYEVKKQEYAKAMESYVPPAKQEDEEGEEDEEDEDEEDEEDQEAVESPAKKAKTDKATEKAQKAEAKAAKAEAKAKPKGKAKAKAKDEQSVNIPKDVLAKAEKADMVSSLTKLLMRDDIKSAGISASKAFDVLSEKNGLLHPARSVLLGA